MNPAERDALREHLLRWQRVGPELEAIRRRELRNYDFDREIANDLLRIAADHAKPREATGLIHLQRLLRKRYS